MIFCTQKTENWLKIERVSPLQIVCIQIFPFGLAHADHCHLLTIFDIENQKLNQNLSCIDASERSYPDVSIWSCSAAAPRLFSDDFGSAQKLDTKSCTSQRFSPYVSLFFSHGLAHADQACSLMIWICISACTQIRPKSLHFDSSVCTYPLAFVLGLAHDDHDPWHSPLRFDIAYTWNHILKRQKVCILLSSLSLSSQIAGSFQDSDHSVYDRLEYASSDGDS